MVQVLYFNFAIIFSYALVIVLARKTFLEIKRQSNSMNSKTRSLQAQISRTLLAQALIPLLIFILPLCVIIIVLVLGLDTYYLGEFITTSLTWNPCLNAISILLFITPYRQYCTKLMCPWCSKKTTTNVTSGSDSVIPTNRVSYMQ